MDVAWNGATKGMSVLQGGMTPPPRESEALSGRGVLIYDEDDARRMGVEGGLGDRGCARGCSRRRCELDSGVVGWMGLWWTGRTGGAIKPACVLAVSVLRQCHGGRELPPWRPRRRVQTGMRAGCADGGVRSVDA
jgi:hypothetical protein